MSANHNTHYIVKNINGTSKNQCNCNSWLEHWENFTGLIAGDCSVRGCTNEATVGAHVLITDGRTPNKWWIVPMCHEHNHYTNYDEMILNKTVVLAPANVSETCSNW